MTAIPILRVQQLTKSYATGAGLLTVLKDISFDVRRGEILVILGGSAEPFKVPGSAMLGKELEILETVRSDVPAEVFTTAYTNPVGGSADAVRGNLREALRWLKEAGYEVRAWPTQHHYFGGVSVVTPNGAAGDPRRSGSSATLRNH